MVWELCTSRGAIVKAGVNKSTITASGSAMATFYNDAEGDLITRTRRNWVVSANASPYVMKAVANVMENEIATRIINYDLNTASLATSQTKLDVLKNNTDLTMAKLIDDNANDIRSVEA